MKQPAAVLGVGQTRHRSKRTDVSIAGLCREAADRAVLGRRALAGRHRRGRGREGARPVRGRDDARAVPGRRAGRGGQAAAAGAHGGFGGRRDRPRRDQPGAGRAAPPGHGGGVREAVGVQRHVGAVDRAAVQHPGGGRRGRVLRAAHPRLHQAQRRAAAHRRAGRGQGPAQRRPQPVRPPAAGRHHAGEGAGLPDAVGPGAVRRDVPVLGRRVRGGHRRLGCRGGRSRAGGLDPGHRDAQRADHVRGQGPRQPGRGPGRRARRCGGRPASPTR